MSSRRSPDAGQRQRDPERSKAQILDAALAEFSERGFAGARTSAIAQRAGVNPQLISYYFDGKAGLYRELSRQWQFDSAAFNDEQLSLAEVVANFVRVNARNRAWARLLIWHSLAPVEDAEDASGYFGALVEGVRRRQQRGELDPALDPATVLIALFGAVLAPVVLPAMVAGATAMPPDSPEFTEYYVEHLRAVVAALAPH